LYLKYKIWPRHCSSCKRISKAPSPWQFLCSRKREKAADRTGIRTGSPESSARCSTNWCWLSAIDFLLTAMGGEECRGQARSITGGQLPQLDSCHLFTSYCIKLMTFWFKGPRFDSRSCLLHFLLFYYAVKVSVFCMGIFIDGYFYDNQWLEYVFEQSFIEASKWPVLWIKSIKKNNKTEVPCHSSCGLLLRVPWDQAWVSHLFS
jgi:hypothetical protein